MILSLRQGRVARVPLVRALALGAALAAAGCAKGSNGTGDDSSSAGSGGSGPSGGGGAAGHSGAAGAGGSSGGSGGSGGASGGSAGGSAGAAGAADAGTAGVGGRNDAAASGGTDTAPRDGAAIAAAGYKCTQFLGPNVTGEWFAAGFESLVDGTRWQVKAPHHSFVEDWANPNHDVWRESNCQGTYSGCETQSKCSNGGKPDRIIFVTQTGNYLGTSQKAWEDLIAGAIKTIKAKYPSVTHVQLMTFVRGPGNQDCGNETTVSPNLDKAQMALAAGSGGAISVSPRFEVPRCDLFSGQPHFSSEGNKVVAALIGKHYAQEEKAAVQ